VEVAGHAAVAAEATYDLSVLTLEGADLVVGAVGIDQESLRRIVPDFEIPYRAIGQRLLLDEHLFHKRAVFPEHLMRSFCLSQT
jgi:hypothetical protein